MGWHSCQDLFSWFLEPILEEGAQGTLQSTPEAVKPARTASSAIVLESDLGDLCWSEGDIETLCQFKAF